jgi:glutathione S-transferase
MQFVELGEAKTRQGMRLVTVGHVPSPWSEAAKGILFAKKIPFVGVRYVPGDDSCQMWTGCNNAPVAMLDDEPPRSGWAEILLQAERIAPERRLVPEDAEQRALLFGLAHEICGEDGLGWNRRLQGIAASLEGEGGGFPKPIAEMLGARYGYRPGCGRHADDRVEAILRLLAERLEAQAASDSPYYLGAELTALDIYSAAFMNLFKPLPPEHVALPEILRAAFEDLDPRTAAALDPILLDHRDRIYAEHLELPLTL